MRAMQRSWRSGIIATVVLAQAVSVASACHARPRDVEAARLLSPVRAVLSVRSWQRDPASPSSRTLALTVADRDIAVRCFYPDGRIRANDPHLPASQVPGALVADETGDRLAFRCVLTDPWTVVYRGTSYGFSACPVSVPPGAMDWTHVPSLEAAAVSLLRCPEPTFATLCNAARERGGTDAVSRLLDATALVDLAPAGSDSRQRDAEQRWLAAFGEETPSAQEVTRARLRGALIVGASSASVLQRAASVVDLSDPAFTSAVLRARLSACTDLDATDGCAMLLRRWTAVDAQAASEFACANLPTEWSRVGATALATLARAGLPCAAFARGHEQDRCARLIGGRACPTATGSHECSLDEQRAEVAAELSYRAGLASPWAADPIAHSQRLAASAASATGVSCAGGTPSPL